MNARQRYLSTEEYTRLGAVLARVEKLGGESFYQVADALQLVQSITDKASRASALEKVAEAQISAGTIDDAKSTLELALQAAHSIEQKYQRNDMLAKVAALQVDAGQIDKALQIALSIANTYERADSLSKVANADHASEALQAASTIEDSAERVSTFVHLAQALPRK